MKVALYQWSLIAEDFGHSEASETWLEFLYRGGDETIAGARYEVGTWYLLGERGIEKDLEKAYFLLAYVVEQFKILEMLDMKSELARVQLHLEEGYFSRFHAIFDLKDK